MDFDFKTLQIKKVNQHVCLVTLNRPEVRNAINSVMMSEFFELWNAISKKDYLLRCIVLTGADNTFSSGADLKERKNISISTWKSQHAILVSAMKSMLQCPIPIISAVNGAAFGGGLELVLSSDFAYASHTAVFAQSEVKLGIIPGAFGTQHLPRTTGLKRAKELIFTGETFTAKEACDWGIINKVCQPDQLLENVFTTANKISENAPIAIKEAKKALNSSQKGDLELGYAKELKSYYCALDTKDRVEGIAAFNEKRKPIYTGE